MPPTLSLEAAIASVPPWRGITDLRTTFLTGGITNLNYRVDVNGESFVLRLGGANTELLGINREHEYAATQAAASLGLAPEVLHFIRPAGYLVARFIPGRPIPPEEMRQPENIRRVAEALKRVHALPAIPGTFSPFRVVESYDEIARRYGVTTFPENYAWLRERMDEVETAFLKDPLTPVPCHNDLLNENFLLEGERLRVIDWEYAGMGDAFFDLGNFAVHHGLSDEQGHFFLECYFGAVSARQVARHQLMKIMSDFREAMWGVVQQGLSQLDFDFRAYAEKYFGRMTASFNDPRYSQWLNEF